MDIRCRKCFKKYDDSFSFCPQCGKDREYNTSNRYSNYQTKSSKNDKEEVENRFKKKEINEGIKEEKNEEKNLSYKKNINGHENSFNIKDNKLVHKLQKMFVKKEHIEENSFDELYDDDVYNYDVLDKVWFIISKKIMSLFRSFQTYRYCDFCGSKSINGEYFCKVCKSRFALTFDTTKTSLDYPSLGKLHSVIEEFIKSKSGFIDVEEFKNKLSESGFNFENWNSNGELKTGIGISKYTSMAIYSSALIFFLIMAATSTNTSVIKAWFVILLVIGNIAAIPLSRKYFSEYISMNSGNVSINSNQNRNQIEMYNIKTIDIKSIEILLNHKMKPENITFRAKKGSEVKNLVYSLSVSKYVNKKSIIEYIILYTSKHNISLYITKQIPKLESNTTNIDLQKTENESDSDLEVITIENLEDIKKEILFVRIDKKIDGATLTELEYSNHMSYLKNISLNGYFMGGGFEKESGGMIIFSAIDEIEANDIAKDDPLIVSGAYTYELKEWNVILKSNNNQIS